MTYMPDSAPVPGGFGAQRPADATRRRVERWTRRPWFFHFLAVAILLAGWHLLLMPVNPRVPSIDEVAVFLWTEMGGGSHGGMNRGEFWPFLGISLLRYAAGLAVGITLGLVLGVLVGGSRWFRSIVSDTLLVLLVLPAVVWAFVASLWFGFGSVTPVVAVAITAVPLVAMNLSSGIRTLDPGLIVMSDAFAVPRVRRAIYLFMGGTAVGAATGVRLAATAGWSSLLIAEWFGSATGVGWRARFWYTALRFEGFVAWILLFVVFITLLDWLVLRRLERRYTRWQQPPTLTFAESNDA
ncbi:ABC transporter permease [Candidatus Poriferisodalis sp.]|uniref:ABC transporter permease n=1 Tax=Candidatus Poriferisodalis sp. TaxID=3101277 RepID=UPI003B010B60